MSITKVKILGKDSIHIGYDLHDHLVKEVIEEIPSSTYVIISDTNIEKHGHVKLLEEKFARVIQT
jgi:pentafunctional AROM polypeptide